MAKLQPRGTPPTDLIEAARNTQLVKGLSGCRIGPAVKNKREDTKGKTKVIGHPRVYKAHALLLGCDATGVRERQLQQRTLPAEFRALKKPAADVLQVWECVGDVIAAARPLGERVPSPLQLKTAFDSSAGLAWSVKHT